MKLSTELKASRVKAGWVQERARVVDHEGKGDINKMTLYAPEIARLAMPGQFVQVKVNREGSPLMDPLLRRPFSLCEIRPLEGEISIVYRVVGRGTRVLASVTAGSCLDLLGPLGYSFPDPRIGKGRLLLVGGGLGIPPMAAAAAWAREAGRDALVLMGARTATMLAGAREVMAAGLPMLTVTDDGTMGMKAVVTEPLERMLGAGTVQEVWACGPEPMLVAVKRLCTLADVPCFVSVERHMACGIGACLGCTVPRADKKGYWKVCQDGPVFDAREVLLSG